MSRDALPRECYLKAQHVLEALRKRKGRVLVTLIGLALIFSTFAVVQHWFVQRQVYHTTSQELSSWAELIADEVAYKDRWDLKGYRNAPILAPTWFILTRDGVVIDIEGFIPGIFGRVDAPDDSIFVGPTSWPTAVGENWRVFGKKLSDGYVVVGISPVDQTSDTDAKLRENAAKFGSTIASAAAIRSREIPSEVDYAVVSSDGELKTAWGGVPVKVDISKLPVPSKDIARVNTDGKAFLLFFKPILDAQHQEVGTIIVPKDMSLEEQALHSQDRFNLWIAGITGALAVATVLTLIVRYELEKRSLEISLEEALKKGEGQSIEFKSGIIDSNVAKIIAAFANTNTGNIFVGVEDNGGVSGLREQTPHERDQLLRKIRQVATMIQPPVSPGATFLYYDGKTVLRVFVPKGAHPLYVLQGTVWIRRLAEVVAADRQEIIERALGARRVRVRPT
jgi:hypothetical protein